MNKTKLVYEPRIIEDVHMPFTFSFTKLKKKHITNAIPASVNWHENIEILYFVDGTATVNIETEEYTVNTGDIVIINSNFIHKISTDTFTEYYYLIPDKDFLTDNEIGLDGCIFKEKITDSKATEYYNLLIEVSQSEGKFNVARIRAAVLSLVAFLGQNYIQQTNKSVYQKHNIYIKKALEFIESDLTKEFSVEEISDLVGLSKYHFMREFKRVTTYSIVEYVNLRRCNRAQILLKDKDKTIYDICVLCGFATTSYFSRVFKKYIGVSPKVYRELITKPMDK